MLAYFLDHIDAALKKIRGNPQLIYTILIAAVIIGAFVFMASRFIGIANDAQERLINVRIGSLQDAFVSFASDKMEDSGYLNQRIADVMSANETIKSFRIVQRQTVFTNATGTAYVIVASNDPLEIGYVDPQAGFLYSLASGDPSHSITRELRSGSERLFNTARVIQDAGGNVLGVAMTVQTLSEADKMIERSIAQSMYLLISVIVLILFLFFRHSRIIDYMELYRRLKGVDQLKDDFISMASHELRTPLTVIRGYTEFLHDVPDLAEGAKEYVQRIAVSAKDLDALISDMLDVSKIEQGRMLLKVVKCGMREEVQNVVTSFEVLAKEKGLALSFDASRADDSQQLLADKDRLHQILVNLVGNAVKYTAKGSVEVSQYAESGRVFVRVRDTGVGISAEDREKLFKKFSRIRTKETEHIGGTGLGLWITAQIVREMNGRIDVESIVGVGTHFIVSFPIAI